ncbi:MAG: (Fe-S)-binding protein [Gammaproteobacteria bacterium]
MKPILDWSTYRDAGLGDAYADIPRAGGDFARAVAVCINSRQCETDRKGVMCPSYRVTGEPALSTGGRVRLLKAALNSDDPDAALDAAELDRLMALCVGCKGCKRECENAVDLAMIKVEYLARRNARKRPPLRTRLLANLSLNLFRYPFLRPLLEWRNASSTLARLGERLLGISARRKVPVPVARPFHDITPQSVVKAEPLGEVVLLIDTFTDQFAPENAHAAIRVLSRAGYSVHIAHPVTGPAEPDRPLCCGRTHIAHGLVDDARAEARRMLDALEPHVAVGRKVLGLEPACLLAIRDDYRFLGLGERADKVANAALLFEEFIAREIQAKRFKPKLRPVDTGGQPLLVHGHCHQKAVGAMKAMRKVLKAIPALEFELIESSCCGGAGSFGIEKENATMSLEMAELSLFPALRAQREAPVLANGFSCRQQIREGVRRDALHIASLLDRSMT